MRINPVIAVAAQYNKLSTNKVRGESYLASAPQDGIELSDGAKLFSAALAKAKAEMAATETTSAQRQEKISALTEQMRSDAYEMDLDGLTDKLLL